MPDPKPKLSNREKREPRQANWSDVSIISMQTEDRHNTQQDLREFDSFKEGELYVTEHDIVTINRLVTQILEHEKLQITDQERKKLKKLSEELSEYQRVAYHEGRGGDHLHEQVQSCNQFQEAEILTINLDKHVNPNEIPLTNERRLYILALSNSHRTNNHILEAAAEQGFEVGQSTAVLAFDHHADVECVYDLPPQVQKHDHNVHTLKDGRAGTLAVFGTPIGRYNTTWLNHHGILDKVKLVKSTDIYENYVPSKEKFLQELEIVLQDWKQRGIEQIFVTVDLDFLRLEEMDYTAVDYRSFVRLAKLISEKGVVYERYKDISDPEFASQVARELLNDYKDYNGLPASWPLLAMELAKKRGFKIGLKNAETGQLIVGDITEYTDNDEGGRTFKVLQSIANGMVHIAQQ